MKLIIPLVQSNKIDWWLNKVNTEWSGIAYYKITKATKLGFPEEVRLEYFNVLDIGSSVETEYKAEDVARAQSKFFNRKDVDFELCFQGLIHSHHNMPANFSRDDNITLNTHAPDENFFFSLIVSNPDIRTKRGFAFSYKDQYGIVQIHTECEVYEEKVAYEIPPDWLKEHEIIEEKKKQLTIEHKFDSKVYGYGSYGKDPITDNKNVVSYSNEFGSNGIQLNWFSPTEEMKNEVEDLIIDNEGNICVTDEFSKNYYFYKIGNNYYWKDLYDIPFEHIQITPEDKFLYESEREFGYTHDLKQRIKAIREEVKNGRVSTTEIEEFSIWEEIDERELINEEELKWNTEL